MRKVAAATLGCKVNQYDTEAILHTFKQNGYEIVDFEEKADIYIVNTCTVTNIGDKKSRQMIRRARTKNKEAIVVATGCYSQISPDEVSGIDGVNIVTGARNRESIVVLVEEYISHPENHENETIVAVSDGGIGEVYENMGIDGSTERTRAYIKVQDGCDQFCSYCAVPYARGRGRSRLPEDVFFEAQKLANAGYKEMIITGIHVASYGKDIGYKDGLIGLLYKVHEINEIERIRLSSIDPCFADEHFAEAVNNLPKLCDHFHLSLQSGCDRTLLAMNRKYTSEGYMRSVKLLRDSRPDVSLTTDVIVGFPGETEEDFKQSYEFITEIKPAMTHVFPYSQKKGTTAAEFPNQIPKAVRHRRAEIMIRLGAKLTRDFKNRFIGRTMNVLVESRLSEGVFQGYTTNYIRVLHESSRDITGKIIPVSINTCNMPEFVL